MKKIALATAALLVAAGSAFAENPSATWNKTSANNAGIDSSYTASVSNGSLQGSHPADEYNTQLNTGR